MRHTQWRESHDFANVSTVTLSGEIFGDGATLPAPWLALYALKRFGSPLHPHDPAKEAGCWRVATGTPYLALLIRATAGRLDYAFSLRFPATWAEAEEAHYQAWIDGGQQGIRPPRMPESSGRQTQVRGAATVAMRSLLKPVRIYDQWINILGPCSAPWKEGE